MDGLAWILPWRMAEALERLIGRRGEAPPVGPQGRDDGGGTEMTISGQFDATQLTEGQRAELKEFYVRQLREEWWRWPGVSELCVYVNNKACEVHRDRNWKIGDGYIGMGQAGPGETTGEQRLGVLGTLMGVTGHAGDAELQREFVAALAKVLAGTYEKAARALVEATGPIERLAFSDRGCAAWMDGAWVGPSGDAVEVGEAWTVVEVRRAEVEVERAPVPEVQSAVQDRESWEEMVRRRRFSTRTSLDGRLMIVYPDRASAEMYGEYVGEDGWAQRLELVEGQGGSWGWAERLEGARAGTPAPVAGRRALAEWAAGRGLNADSHDGAAIVGFAEWRNMAEAALAEATEAGVAAELADLGAGETQWQRWLRDNEWGWCADRTPPHIVFGSVGEAREVMTRAALDGMTRLEVEQTDDGWVLRETRGEARAAAV